MSISRVYLAAPGVGLVSEGAAPRAGATRTYLEDRVANGEAYPGERIVRVPRRLMRRFVVPHLHYSVGSYWQLKRALAKADRKP